jgi:hypothetical protein
MITQMEVCWMRDHFPHLTQDEIATLVDIPWSLVIRYAKLQEKQREYARDNERLRTHISLSEQFPDQLTRGRFSVRRRFSLAHMAA